MTVAVFAIGLVYTIPVMVLYKLCTFGNLCLLVHLRT